MPRKLPTSLTRELVVADEEPKDHSVSQSGKEFSFPKAGFSVTNMGVTGPVGKAVIGQRVESFDELDMDSAVRIGSGSSGRVFECMHKPSGQLIVVKVIDVDEGRARTEIIKELEALYADKSRFIVEFYGAFFHEGSIYIALERMDGSLLDAVQLTGKVPENVCRGVARYVMQGLLYLHSERRKIHRDIKPSNLLFNQKGEVKVTDFGVSSGFLNTTNYEAETFVGTVTYMSPERLAGKPHSYGADIWSVGLSLVECVTGSHPFKAFGVDGKVNYWVLFDSVGKAETRFLSPQADGVSEEMAHFISLCLEKDKDKRPSALELLAHSWLMGFSDDEAVAAVRPFAEQVAVLKMRRARERDREKAAALNSQTSASNILDAVLGFD
ncbi:Mitogen-activated protein kinase kinase 1 [Diplonema papillatum]|nr:Mitogen-activated protein kinase kinase 1 [Diplonema papillatum]